MQYSGSVTFVAVGAGGSTVNMSTSDNSLSESWSVVSRIRCYAFSADKHFPLSGISAIRDGGLGLRSVKHFDVEKTVHNRVHCIVPFQLN